MAKLVIRRGVSDALRLVSFEGVDFGWVSRTKDSAGTEWSFYPEDDLPCNLPRLVPFSAQYLRQIRAELESRLSSI